MRITMVAMGNVLEELCISNGFFCSVELTVVKILLEETLKPSDSPLQSKKGDVSNSVSPKGEDQRYPCYLFSVVLLL